ncbi:MAG: WYL domain-containing protein [Vampirovibrio sp.]|nr:WYL domain-containing protein [Vampirovibrio sp.]
MKSDTLNTTAYRIYCILVWLSEQSLSVEELNDRFVAEPMIRRKLSDDTIWLYMNTLKELGCNISRPVPTNGFRYQLISHPFGVAYTKDDVQTMVQVKRFAEDNLTFLEILTLDRFFKKLLHTSSSLDKDRLIQDLFKNARSQDYHEYAEMIDMLSQAVSEHKLLQITYESPVKGDTQFYFLPEALCYEKGMLYVQGNQENRPDRVLLRVDRILDWQETNRPDITEPLLHAQTRREDVVVKFFQITLHDFLGLDLGEHLVDYSPTQDANREESIEAVFKTNDFFGLKQKILESATPFEVQKPSAFREEMELTLVEMKKLYA